MVRRYRSLLMFAVFALLAVAVGAALAWDTLRGPRLGAAAPVITDTPRFGVTIGQPAGPPMVNTGQSDFHGQPIAAACSTCHTTKPPNVQINSSDQLKEFHQGLHFQHGSLTCVSCHNPGDYDSLRLADGRRIEFSNVMQLCAQCHGPQARDYQNGAHGGMTGYWDLSRGPRQRNNCIDCHEPHVPAYPQMRPVPAPPVRGRTTPAKEHAHE